MSRPLDTKKVFANLYRLQLSYKFPFAQVEKYLKYFHELGIDALYLSPIFQAKDKSLHGYDIVSPLQISEDLGGEKGFISLSKKAKAYGISIVVDVVANHMSTDLKNPWWQDLLRHGKRSKYSSYFDISWDTKDLRLKNKLMVPVLEESYQESLDLRKISALFKEGELWIHYGGAHYPLTLITYDQVLKHVDHLQAKKFCKEASSKGKTSYETLLARLKLNWDALAQQIPDQISDACQRVSKDQKLLDQLLKEQHYLLEYWQAAPKNINYRRFFDINDLAAVSMQKKEIFEEYHNLLLDLIKKGVIQGIRVDHPDGFYSPRQYFKWLQAPFDNSLYVIVEKILEKNESLPSDWNVLGSVGYEHLNMMTHLFIDSTTKSLVTKFYENFTGVTQMPEQTLFEEKLNIGSKSLRSEVDRLTDQLESIFLKQNFIYEKDKIYEALLSLFCVFSVYRTYLEKPPHEISKKDEKILELAFSKAKTKCAHEEILTALRSVFDLKGTALQEKIAFVMRFQQICPSIMAKGFEDTHLYNNNQFLALNEVGGWLKEFGLSTEEFHERIQKKLTISPFSWITASTHDTKRSEGVRMRLAALSEIFEEFQVFCEKLYKHHDKTIKSIKYLDKNMIYFVYQTLVGFWPSSPTSSAEKKKLHQRLESYFLKAAKESKAHTSWGFTNQAYENALKEFVLEILSDETSIEQLSSFVKPLAKLGSRNVLSSLAIKIGLPAGLDIYQGTEWIDYALVDPDNRSEVDFDARSQMLFNKREFKGSYDSEKMILSHKGFQYRRDHKDVIFQGKYLPIHSSIDPETTFIAYGRVLKEKKLLVIARRFFSKDLKNERLEIPKSLTGHYSCLLSKRSYQFEKSVNLKNLLNDKDFLILSSC